MAEGQQSFQDRLARLEEKRAAQGLAPSREGPNFDWNSPGEPAAEAPRRTGMSGMAKFMIGFCGFVLVVVLGAGAVVLNTGTFVQQTASASQAPAATEDKPGFMGKLMVDMWFGGTASPEPRSPTRGFLTARTAGEKPDGFDRVAVRPDQKVQETEAMGFFDRILVRQHNSRVDSGYYEEMATVEGASSRLKALARVGEQMGDKEAGALADALDTCAEDDVACLTEVISSQQGASAVGN